MKTFTNHYETTSVLSLQLSANKLRREQIYNSDSPFGHQRGYQSAQYAEAVFAKETVPPAEKLANGILKDLDLRGTAVGRVYGQAGDVAYTLRICFRRNLIQGISVDDETLAHLTTKLGSALSTSLKEQPILLQQLTIHTGGIIDHPFCNEASEQSLRAIDYHINSRGVLHQVVDERVAGKIPSRGTWGGSRRD